jgi:hypothetical protein
MQPRSVMGDVVAFKSVPVSVIHIRPRKAARPTHGLLLVPVLGAFVQIVWTKSIPSLGWAFLVLVAALMTRILKARAEATSLPAELGADGVLLGHRFVAASEIRALARRDGGLYISTKSGERIELRLPDDGAAAVAADALAASLSSGRKNDIELVTPPDDHVYRGGGVDPERCLALVEDAALPPRTRVSAARLLADRMDDGARIRIASVADATANPILRETLLEALAPRERR